MLKPLSKAARKELLRLNSKSPQRRYMVLLDITTDQLETQRDDMLDALEWAIKNLDEEWVEDQGFNDINYPNPVLETLKKYRT